MSAGQSQNSKHLLTVGLASTAVLLFVAVLAVGLKLDPNVAESALIGKPALPFSGAVLQGAQHLKDRNKNAIVLDDFLGKPLVLNFWASWCVSCRQEAREMEQFWQTHKGEVQMLGLAIQDTPEDAKQFAYTYGKTYPLALDEQGTSSINYGVVGVPETFIIDSKGIIRYKFAGPVSEKLLSQKLAELAQPEQ